MNNYFIPIYSSFWVSS